ncbi:rRNA biogenesis protein RRP36 [Grifola frondosa]|uniref:rRNA biogenesis protein RRP36 n=1 Tax=Grifola frondosa TaxID=5627 RepID=A0A1C7MTR0_GRIFR|nr:rRNA biogenesis protein RRP36 [Grifola frondosa]
MESGKRKHKHAPVEMTSKRPVPRKRLSAETKVVARDPRFLHLAGEFSAQKFSSQYGFLSDMHTEEMKTLRENLKRARKLLVNSPRDLREEREAEVQRLERAVKRAESMVNKDQRERVEREALEKVSKEERAKQKEGKSAWFMKNSDKKELLLRAKFDALAESGGRGAVRKAIEKKQKKVSQKEKKQRPFAAARPGEGCKAKETIRPANVHDSILVKTRADLESELGQHSHTEPPLLSIIGLMNQLVISRKIVIPSNK